jgi:hypothetical protein
VVYHGHGKFMLLSSSKTVRGLWIAMPPWDQLPDDAPDAELGRAIQAVLEGSRVGAPHPEPGVSASDYNRDFLRAVGFRSVRAMTRGTRAVIASEVDGHLEADVAGRDGLLTGEVIASHDLSADDLARTVRIAIAKSGVIWE